MPKAIPDAVMDLDIDYIKDNCNLMTLCSAEPTTYLEAIATFELADVAMAAGDFTIQNHAPDGREMVVAAKVDVPVDVGGAAVYVTLVKTGTTELLAVDTCPSCTLTLGGTADIGSWKIIKRDPT